MHTIYIHIVNLFHRVEAIELEVDSDSDQTYLLVHCQYRRYHNSQQLSRLTLWMTQEHQRSLTLHMAS